MLGKNMKLKMVNWIVLVSLVYSSGFSYALPLGEDKLRPRDFGASIRDVENSVNDLVILALGILKELENNKGLSAEGMVKIFNERFGRMLDRYGVKERVNFNLTIEGSEYCLGINGTEVVWGYKEEIEEIIQNGSCLVFANEANSIDQRLRVYAAVTGQRYLRVNLRDVDELNKLVTEVIVDGEGGYRVVEGELVELIKEGGILFIDYNEAEPKLVEGLNSLFDSVPYFTSDWGRQDASPGLKIVGTLNKAQFNMYPTSFYSRYKRIVEKDWTFRNPLKIEEAPETGDYITAGLFESPLYEDELIGRYYIDLDGKLRVVNGRLITAIEDNKPLVISGGLWDDRYFVQFLTQIVMAGGFRFNGRFYKLPLGFKIMRYDEDYSEGVEDKRIVYKISPSDSPLWVINESNQDVLFSRIRIDNDRREITQIAGVLEESGHIRIRITGFIKDWVWHRIMHSKAKIKIEIDPGAPVPTVYQRWIDKKTLKEKEPSKIVDWDSTENEKIILVSGSDIGFVLAKIRKRYGKPLVYPITPNTKMGDLVSSIELEPGRRFRIQVKDVLNSLRRGETVVLEGLERNGDLAEQLQTVLSSEPYLLENGKRVELKGLTGRLILIGPLDRFPYAGVKVQLEPDDKEIADILKKEFGISDSEYEVIVGLREIFRSIPRPEGRIYPRAVNLNLNRLRMLCRYRKALGEDNSNWLRAFESIVISDYMDSPETAGFMRVRVRLGFRIEDNLGKEINGRRLHSIMNSIIYPARMEDRYWQLIDTMGFELLDSLGISREFHTRRRDILEKIQYSLAGNATGEKRAFYKGLFGIKKVPILSGRYSRAVITEEVDTWEEREDRCTSLLRLVPAIFLRGQPGAGKSFICSILADKLGLRMYGPVPMGADIGEDDVIVERRYIREDEEAVYVEKTIAQWARDTDGGLLVIDEANLTNPHFWGFLEGLFSPEPYIWLNGVRQGLTSKHRVVFTGNKESMIGREYQELFSEHVPTVNFPEFNRQFLNSRIQEYMDPDKKGLTEDILDIFFMFKKMGIDRSFSLRDIQEICYRLNLIRDRSIETRDILSVSWDVLKGLFSAEEQIALQHIIGKRYGIDIMAIEVGNIGDTTVGLKIPQIPHRLVLTRTARGICYLLNRFLTVRESCIGSLTATLYGKRGLVFEGPSGVGKDLLAIHLLKKLGYREGNIDGESIREKNQKVYYQISASVNYDDMVRVINRAREEGSIVVISEVNLIPSGILEGKLNSALTGDAEQGFCFIGTINSTDFSGRERFSTALQNRVIYYRVYDYTQDELREIVIKQGLGGILRKDLELLVNYHCWVRNHIKNPSQRPTIRELFKVIELLERGNVLQDSLNIVYGHVYLNILRVDGVIEPVERIIRQFKEPQPVNNHVVLERIAHFIMPEREKRPSLAWDSVLKDGGYYDYERNLIGLSTKNSLEYNLRTIDHESGHALFTRSGLFPGLMPTPDWHNLYMWLEDMRMENALRRYFPYIDLANESEIGFIAAVRGFNLEFILKMNSRSIFLYALSSYARGFITEKDINRLSIAWGKIYGVKEPNPFRLAERHLNTARSIAGMIPDTLDEEEIQYQFYKALRLIHTMKEDFLGLPKVLEEDTGKKGVDVADKELSRTDLKGLAVGREGKEFPEKGGGTRVDYEKVIRDLKEARLRRLGLTREEVRRELNIMEEDLLIADMDRLEEMLELLDDGAIHPHSLVPRLKELRDSSINRQAARLKKRIRERIERLKNLTKLVESLFSGWLSDLGTGIGYGRGTSGLQGRRYPRPSTHSADWRKEPVLMDREPRIRELRQRLGNSETHPRDDIMKGISTENDAVLRRLLALYFYNKLSIGKVHGPDGCTLDIQRFATGDPAKAFIKSGASFTDMPREIILTQKTEPGEWNPVIEEVFMFLFSIGFTVTVFTGDNYYISGIKTLSDLKNISSRPSSCDPRLIREQLGSTRSGGGYIITTLRDIQRCVETEYLYQVLVTEREFAVSPKSAEPIKPEIPPEERERQSEVIVEFLKDNGIPEDRLEVLDDGFFKLNLSYTQITDLRPLSGLTNLKKLDLTGTQITDLSPLSGLTNLEELHLSSPQITDLRPLSGLANLKVLYLSRTQITDLRPLSGLTNLKVLVLGSTQITDLSPLSGLANLEVLWLRGTRITDNQIYGLFRDNPNREKLEVTNKVDREIKYADVPDKYKKLPKPAELTDGERERQSEVIVEFLEDNGIPKDRLKVLDDGFFELNLTGTQIRDLSPLSGLTNLEKLYLYGTQITDLRPLSGLINLEKLNLVSTQIIDPKIYELFRDNPNREKLVVWNKDGREITYADVPEEYKEPAKPVEIPPNERERQSEVILEFLKDNGIPEDKLEVLDDGFFMLDLRDTQITDLMPLRGLTNLEALDLTDTQITDLRPLSGLTNLKELVFFDTQITDLIPLSGLTNLEVLDLSGTQITDLRPLSGLTNLKVLYLWGTQITDLSPLSGLTNLEELDLSDTQITDIQIYELFRDNPNREKLVVRNKDDREITYADVPEGYRKPAEPPKPVEIPAKERERQRQVILGFLRDNGISEGKLVVLDDGFFRLDLSDTQITDLSPLSGLTNLKELDLGRTQITDLSPLSRLTNLEELSLIGTEITDLNPLKGLTNLKELHLYSVRITDLSPLSGLTNLEALYLDRTRITDLSLLSGLTNLEALSLFGTQITDTQIYELFRDNPNREKLVVRNKDGRKITYADVPEEYKEPAKPTEIVREVGVPSTPREDLVSRIVRSLVEPHETLPKVRERLESSGKGDLYGLVEKFLPVESPAQTSSSEGPVQPSTSPIPGAEVPRSPAESREGSGGLRRDGVIASALPNNEFLASNAVNSFVRTIKDDKVQQGMTILALDMDIGNMQEFATGLLAELTRQSESGRLGNIFFIRGNGNELQGKINDKIREMDEGFNIVLVAKESNVEGGLYNELKGREDTHILGVNDKNLAEGCYIPILELLTFALSVVYNKDSYSEVSRLYTRITHAELTEEEYRSIIAERLILITLPPVEPIDIDRLGEVYRLSSELLTSA